MDFKSISKLWGGWGGEHILIRHIMAVIKTSTSLHQHWDIRNSKDRYHVLDHNVVLHPFPFCDMKKQGSPVIPSLQVSLALNLKSKRIISCFQSCRSKWLSQILKLETQWHCVAMWQQGKRARGEIASSDHFILVSLPLFSMSCPTPATSRFPCCASSQVPILRPSCLIHVCWLTSPSNSKLGTTTTNACD